MKRNWLLDLIYPWKCPFCGKILSRKEGELCSTCRKELPCIREPRCMKCGKPIRDERKEYCFDCQNKTHLFEEGRSVWIHQMPVSAAIYRFKYQGVRTYGVIFGKYMGREFKQYLIEREIELIIPIPLHKRRKRARGYNQAELLAEEISSYTGIPYDHQILIRTKYTSPQKQLNDVERKNNIKNAFAIKKPVMAKNVVLIDDIYTTGSTIDEAAEILRNAGVSKVYFLTISIGQGF